MPSKTARLIAAAAVVVGIAGCAGTHQSPTDVGGSENGVPTYGTSIISSGDRHTVGDVTGTTLQGKPFDLASLRGKWVVVNFWYANCAPCIAEEPGFVDLSQQLATKNVAFLGIDERDNLSAALAYEHQFGVTYPSLYDRNNSHLLDFPGALPSTTPFTIIIDPQGKVSAKAAVSLDYTHLQSFIRSVTNVSA